MKTKVSELLADIGVDTRKYVEKFEVSAVELKQAFLDINDVLKKATEKILAIRSAGSILYIRASSGVIYESPIHVIGEPISTVFDHIVAHRDIAELLPNEGTVTITITSSFISIETATLEIDLSIVNSIVNEAPEAEGTEVSAELTQLRRGLLTLVSLNTLANTYKQSNRILLKGSYAQVRYPSMWIETKSSGLDTVVDINSAFVISSFLKNSRNLTTMDCDKYLTLKNDHATLYVPRTETGNLEAVDDMLLSYNFAGMLQLSGIKHGLQAGMRALGKVNAEVLMYEKATELVIKDHETKLRVADNSDPGRLLLKFTIRLEFLNLILKMLDDSVEVYEKGELICLKSSQVKVILSLLA